MFSHPLARRPPQGCFRALPAGHIEWAAGADCGKRDAPFQGGGRERLGPPAASPTWTCVRPNAA